MLEEGQGSAVRRGILNPNVVLHRLVDYNMLSVIYRVVLY